VLFQSSSVGPKSFALVCHVASADETDASSARTEPPFGDVAEPSMGNCWYLNCRLAIFLAARSLSSIFRAFKQAIGRREMQYAFNF
jgi:hypothetical protein